jgi:hypothetical protein
MHTFERVDANSVLLVGIGTRCSREKFFRCTREAGVVLCGRVFGWFSGNKKRAGRAWLLLAMRGLCGGWGFVSSRRHTAQKRTFRVHVDVAQRQRASAFVKVAEICVRPALFPPHVIPMHCCGWDLLLSLCEPPHRTTHPPLTRGNTRRTSQISSPLQSRIFYLKGPPEDLDRWEVGEHLPQSHKTTRARTSTHTA